MELKNKQLSETHYRSLKDRLSYSNIKDYITDRKKFYTSVILGEYQEKDDTMATIIGSLIHCFLAGQEFETKFHLSQHKGLGQTQMGELVDELYKRALKSMDSEGKQTTSFISLFSDAFDAVKYDGSGNEVAFKKKTVEDTLEKFIGSDAEFFYKEKLLGIGKTVVTVNILETAERLTEKLKSHMYTQYYANVVSNPGVLGVYNELTILFDFMDIPCRSMVDKVIVDHENKTIQPLDWKSSWDAGNVKYVYLKQRYYLQAAMYNYALIEWAKQEDIGNYQVLPMKFIFCDTKGFLAPVILELDGEDIYNAMVGFTDNGRYYMGLEEAFNNIDWHLGIGDWTTTPQLYENNGIIKLNKVKIDE